MFSSVLLEIKLSENEIQTCFGVLLLFHCTVSYLASLLMFYDVRGNALPS